MTHQQSIRHECLLQLYGSGAIPISLDHIRKVARRGGFDFRETELRTQLHFLNGQGFCQPIQNPATGETRYLITSAGMLAYEKDGAACVGTRHRIGKIARLPKTVRDKINQLLQEGVSCPAILNELGQDVAGISAESLRTWMSGGYQDWLVEQQRLGDMQATREFALATIQKEPIANLHETALQLAAAQLYEVLSDFDINGLKKLLAEKPAEYNALVTSFTRLAKTHLDFEKHRAQIEEQKRKIETELGHARTDGGLSPETIEKIEEALNLM